MAERLTEVTLIPCPSPVLLDSWVGLLLSEDETCSIRQHVQQCASCQKLLEEKTGSPYLQGWEVKSGYKPPTLSDVSFTQLVDRIHLRLASFHSTRNSDPDTMLEKSENPPLQVGRYVIRRELGQGGMAVVYEAWDSKLQRNVALKLLRSGRDNPQARLLREAHAFAQIQNDHVVSVFDVEQSGDQAWFTMEVMDGPSLAQLIRQEPGRPIASLVDVVEQAARGLMAVHRRGIIHRDVKPSNILTNQEGKAKISDFGLVQWSDDSSQLTQTGVALGTPVFMSPEQAEGKTLDHRTDIYSLGASLYEVLTGVMPFQGTPLRIMEQVRLTEPIPVRQLNENIPIDLETICQKAMSKAPDQRYQAMDAVVADLENWRKGKPITARPLGSWGKLQRWVKREPKLATAIGTTFFALLTGLSVALWQWNQVRQERETAERRYHDAFDAVESMIAVSDQPAMNLPGMQPARNELLTKSISYLDMFTRERKKDPTVRLQYLKTINRLISLRQSLQGNQASLEYTLGILPDVRQALATEADNAAVREECLRTLTQLAYRYLAMNQLTESLAICAEAQPFMRNETDGERRLSTNLQNTMGLIAKNQGKFSEASAYFKVAVDNLQTDITRDDSNQTTRVTLAETYYNLGLLHMARSEWDPAAKYLEQSLELLIQVHQLTPTQQRKEKITNTIYNLSGCYFFLNKPEQVDKVVRTMHDEMLQLAVENPKFTSIQLEAAKLVECLMYANIFQGKFQAALEQIPTIKRLYQQLDKVSPLFAHAPQLPRWHDHTMLFAIHVHQFELESASQDLEGLYALFDTFKKDLSEASPIWKSAMEQYWLNRAFLQHLCQDENQAIQSMQQAILFADRSILNYVYLCKAAISTSEESDPGHWQYGKAVEELLAYFRFNYRFPINHHLHLLCYLKASQLASRDSALTPEQRKSQAETYRQQALVHLSLAAKCGLYDNPKWQVQLNRNELPRMLADSELYQRITKPSRK